MIMQLLNEKQRLRIFDLTKESEETRDRYGRDNFGQGHFGQKIDENKVRFVEAYGDGMHTTMFGKYGNSWCSLDSGLSSL